MAIKGFTGAVALAGATQAYGGVVMVTPPANITGTAASGEAVEGFDVNGDGSNDLFFGAGAANVGGSKYLAYTGVSATSGGVVGYVKDGAYYYASSLQKGTVVGSLSDFVQGSYLTTLEVKYGSATEGQFPNGKTSYLGFDFTAADGLHYGYIELSSQVASTAKPATSSGSLHFVEAFYDSTPGEAITIGAIAVPEPSSVAALAFGAAGVAAAVAYRRKLAASSPA